MIMATLSLLSTTGVVPLLRSSAWTKIIKWYIAIMLALSLPAWLHAGETGHNTWSYEGNQGPLRWGKLGPEFSLCEKGMAQSPVDLLRAHKTTLNDIYF